MNKRLKNMVIISVSILSSTFFISGCGKSLETKKADVESKQVSQINEDKTSSDSNNSSNREKNKISNEKKIEKYSEELAKFVPQKQNIEYLYTGTLDYRHKISSQNLQKSDEILTVAFNGEVEDLSGGESKNTSSNIFNLKYIVNSDSVKESYDKTITNPSKPFAKERVILKAPLKEGTTFSNEYLYKNKKYNGTTKIDKITKDEKKTKVITTTIISGIDGFKNKEFKEVREYEIEKGLVYTSFNTDIEGLDFSYKLFKISEKDK